MYARTDNGIIGKILNSNSDEMINGPEILVNEKIYCIERNSIKEIKKKIIDLLEEGDIVNKEEIIEVRKQNGKTHLMTSYCPQKYIRHEIQEILTKEQYKANCYTVERKEEC